MQTFHEPAFQGRIGVAREDITPPVGIYAKSWGAATHDVAEGIHRPLTATVLTLQTDADEPALVLASLDLGWWRTREDEWFVRGGLIEALLLDPAKVMLAFTHTHAGPGLCREDVDKPGGELVAPYLTSVRDALIRATQHALETAQTATLTWANGVCDLAKNRDLPDPDKDRFVCGYNADVPADNTLLVGRVTAENGATLATLVNYACHPTTLAWENRLISPDFIGAMRELVETHTENAPCLFLQGASGELAPREQYTADTALADSIGRQLGFSVLATLTGMLSAKQCLTYQGVMESGAPLSIWRREPTETSTRLQAMQANLPLPLKDLPSIAEIEAELATTTEPFAVERLHRKRRVRMTVGEGDTSQVPFWIWRVGDALFVGHPMEAYSLFQTELRCRYPECAVVAINVVNGHYGYMPPAERFGDDLYPVWQTPFAAGCLEQSIAFCASELQHFE